MNDKKTKYYDTKKRQGKNRICIREAKEEKWCKRRKGKKDKMKKETKRKSTAQAALSVQLFDCSTDQLLNGNIQFLNFIDEFASSSSTPIAVFGPFCYLLSAICYFAYFAAPSKEQELAHDGINRIGQLCTSKNYGWSLFLRRAFSITFSWFLWPY